MSERTSAYLRQLTQTVTDINPLLDIYEAFDYLTEREIRTMYLAVLLYQNGFKYDAKTFIASNLDKNKANRVLDILITVTTQKGIIEC